jgi:hypothetical protein
MIFGSTITTIDNMIKSLIKSSKQLNSFKHKSGTWSLFKKYTNLQGYNLKDFKTNSTGKLILVHQNLLKFKIVATDSFKILLIFFFQTHFWCLSCFFSLNCFSDCFSILKSRLFSDNFQIGYFLWLCCSKETFSTFLTSSPFSY